jgi:hypothetical protein
MKVEIGEKRREVRRAADGSAWIRFDDPRPRQIDGRLIDVSASGFRMSHDCVWLESGQVVEFWHTESAGRARVVWNRVVAGRVESGFVVV